MQLELARLRKLVSDLRALGYTGFAAPLEESAATLERKIAKLIGIAEQQQQQIQPKEKE